MGQVRWAGWAISTAAALAVVWGGVARADITSDRPAAILVYPKVAFDSSKGIDTVVRLSNTNQNTAILAHCFYLDANSHCSGGTGEGKICTEDPTICTGGLCVPGWQEVDFRIRLTPAQPIEWKASDGLLDGRSCDGGSNDGDPCKIEADCPGGTCTLGIPFLGGVCERNPFQGCAVDADCNPFPGGSCTPSNNGTRIPGVPEDPFVGELKCIAIDEDGIPVPRNELKGEALVETATTTNLDVASYNAVAIQATGASTGDPRELVLGGDDPEYNGCPNFLILNHFFYGARNPVPGVPAGTEISTNLVLVPCSEDLLRQIPGSAVVQYLVFNEFEQRFSTSKSVTCFQDIPICNIDTRDCSRSIFNVTVAGTLTGQTRINPIGIPPLPSGLVGVAFETHKNGVAHSAAFNLHQQGARPDPDVITIP